MLTVISLASNRVSSLVGIHLVLRSSVIRTLVPGFPDVILLPRIDSKMLSHPLHILQPDVVVLTERKADPVLRQQNSAEMRVIGVLHAEHVVDLALEPVRGRPDAE